MTYRLLHFVMWWIVRPVVTPFMRWWHRREQPPKGTRPEVRLTYDGVTYDVTETLVRAPDTEAGLAVWVVTGPTHLVFHPGLGVNVVVRWPEPKATRIDLQMIGTEVEGRFRTLAELREVYPGIELE